MHRQGDGSQVVVGWGFLPIVSHVALLPIVKLSKNFLAVELGIVEEVFPAGT